MKENILAKGLGYGGGWSCCRGHLVRTWKLAAGNHYLSPATFHQGRKGHRVGQAQVCLVEVRNPEASHLDIFQGSHQPPPEGMGTCQQTKDPEKCRFQPHRIEWVTSGNQTGSNSRMTGPLLPISAISCRFVEMKQKNAS